MPQRYSAEHEGSAVMFCHRPFLPFMRTSLASSTASVFLTALAKESSSSERAIKDIVTEGAA